MASFDSVGPCDCCSKTLPLLEDRAYLGALKKRGSLCGECWRLIRVLEYLARAEGVTVHEFLRRKIDHEEAGQ